MQYAMRRSWVPKRIYAVPNGALGVSFRTRDRRGIRYEVVVHVKAVDGVWSVTTLYPIGSRPETGDVARAMYPSRETAVVAAKKSIREFYA